MATPHVEPEVYWLPASVYIPNSRYPVLVYRNVVPTDQGPDAIKAAVEKNRWLARGTWGHIPRMHYHTTTHECYAPIAGSTTVCYGVWESDDPATAVKFDLRVGDVEVHPAGTGHSHVESTPDYKYFGFYPEGAPTVDSVYDLPRLKEDTARREAKFETAASCPIPDHDPVYGLEGPLPRLYREAAAAAATAVVQ